MRNVKALVCMLLLPKMFVEFRREDETTAVYKQRHHIENPAATVIEAAEFLEQTFEVDIEQFLYHLDEVATGGEQNSRIERVLEGSRVRKQSKA